VILPDCPTIIQQESLKPVKYVCLAVEEEVEHKISYIEGNLWKTKGYVFRAELQTFSPHPHVRLPLYPVIPA